MADAEEVSRGTVIRQKRQTDGSPNLDVNAAFVHFLADRFLSAAGARGITWTGAWATFNF
jgi:hypothetical protein